MAPIAMMFGWLETRNLPFHGYYLPKLYENVYENYHLLPLDPDIRLCRLKIYCVIILYLHISTNNIYFHHIH